MSENKILAFAGHKQAGKSSAVNFIVGMELASLGLISSFHLSPEGKLIVPCQLENGDIVEGEWDMTQQEMTWEGMMFLDQNVYPFVKTYNFADSLKKIAVEIFGCNSNVIFGTDEEKNMECGIYWENLPHYSDIKANCKKNHQDVPTGEMTGRQFLQELGTGVFRHIKDDCWYSHTLRMIQKEQPEMALIGDCRFKNEAEAILNAGGKVIYLGKEHDNTDLHQSEKDMDGFDGFSAIIDNTDMTIKQKNDAIYKLLKEWNYLSFEIKTQENNENEYEKV